MPNFTPEDLLEYHYGEMPTSSAALIEKALEEDWTLRKKHEVITEAAARLDKSICAPRQEVLDRIFVYASTGTSVQAIF